MAFKEISIHDLQLNPFDKIGRDWALLTAGDASGSNTMTVAGAAWACYGTATWQRSMYGRSATPSSSSMLPIASRSPSTTPSTSAALGILGSKSRARRRQSGGGWALTPLLP